MAFLLLGYAAVAGVFYWVALRRAPTMNEAGDFSTMPMPEGDVIHLFSHQVRDRAA
jgi:hypothetical protein